MYARGRPARAESMHKLRETEQTAIRLDWDGINAIPNTINEDLLKEVLKKTTERLSEAEVLGERDCCVFKTFVALHGLKSAPPFLRDGDVTCNIYTLYRLCSLCIFTALNPVSK